MGKGCLQNGSAVLLDFFQNFVRRHFANQDEKNLVYSIANTGRTPATYTIGMRSQNQIVAAGETGEFESQLFVGPKNVNRLEEIVEDERNKAAGRARVAKDSINMEDVNMQAAEEEALAEMALADFAAAEGIELASEEKPAAEEPEKKSETTQGSMGPEVSE